MNHLPPDTTNRRIEWDKSVRADQPIINMRWRRFLFAHWRVPAEQMRKLVPPEVEIDTFDGSAWIGLVPFQMTETVFRRWRFLPSLREFRECNVRTYVRHKDRRGVWFFSLDAQHRMPVIGGHLLWSLNYRHSRFQVEERGDFTSYALQRVKGDGATHMEWEMEGPEWHAEQDSLEHFLVERYHLFTKRRGTIRHGQVHHHPWPLRKVRTSVLKDSLLARAGFGDLAQRTPDHLMGSEGVHVLGWGLK